MFRLRKRLSGPGAVEKERKTSNPAALGWAEAGNASLSKRTQTPLASGAKATTCPISKTLLDYKFFLYRHLEKAPCPRSGTYLADLIVEATSVESLEYRSVPALPLPSEIHSPELSPNPLHTCRIAPEHGLTRCPYPAWATGGARTSKRLPHSVVRREAL